jgi:hypothetical protein
MQAKNLDELHKIATTEEILKEVRVRLGLPEELPDLDLFITAYDKYCGHCGSQERAVVDFQIFRQTNRIPLFVASWILNQPAEST